MLKSFLKQCIVFGSAIMLFFSFFMYNFFITHGCLMAQEIYSVDDIKKLFPKTTQEIKKCSAQAQKLFKQRISEILNLPCSKYTYENIGQVYDVAYMHAYTTLSRLLIVQLTNTEKNMRDTAQKEFLELEKVIIESAYHNVDLYTVFKIYHEEVEPHQTLSYEQKRFIEKLLEDFHRRGINLSSDDRQLVENLQKEISVLASEFEQHIADDVRNIAVTKDELQGLKDDFINSLEKNEEGLFILGVDYPTVFTVLENCKIAETRKRLHQEFNNRANPKNEDVLNRLRKKRYRVATLLGYNSFAGFQIADEMAKSPERVQEFLDELFAKSQMKSRFELESVICNLPESVVLSPDGKIYPWDTAFLFASYKKSHIQIDEEELSHYFAVENTLKELLNIYSQFFGISFEVEKTAPNDFWDKDVRLVRVNDTELNKTLGYILLDLFPRSNKFSHAACEGTIPVLEKNDGSTTLGLAFVIANFPKETAAKPALLKRTDVITFFHEFGHALHHLLSSTQTSYFAGTRVKGDFVEMPSQMLEEWMWDPIILKKVSKHYQTGEPLSDNLIDNILKIKHIESGYWVLRQAMYSQLSLDVYSGTQKNAYDVNKENFKKHLQLIEFDSKNHTYLSFGHLTTYAAEYYGYLWSKVFAIDLFYFIKPFGLLDNKIGKRYKEEILRKGGSVDPDILLKNFLGRDPNNEAFFKDLGL